MGDFTTGNILSVMLVFVHNAIALWVSYVEMFVLALISRFRR
jgi:hypothetical protein